MLVDVGTVPACGASLRGVSPHSACARDGRLTLGDLHLDHDPPLQDHERDDEAAVCDPQRVGFLCAACHAAKTNQERTGTAPGGGVKMLTDAAARGPRGGLVALRPNSNAPRESNSNGSGDDAEAPAAQSDTRTASTGPEIKSVTIGGRVWLA